MDSTQRTRPRGGGSPVGLVIFIILTVIFAVLSYWGFAKYKEAQQLANSNQTKLEAAQKSLATTQNDMKALQQTAGAQNSDALKGFVDTTLEKTRALGFGSEAQETAADAMQSCVKAMEAQRDENAKLISNAEDLAAQVKSLDQQKDAAQATYEQEITDLHSQIALLNKQIADAKSQADANLQKELDARNRLQQEYYTAQDTWRDMEMKYVLHVAELQQRIRELSGEGVILEQADGVVTSVDRVNQKTTINIGTDSSVKPGMRFVVFTKSAQGATIQKGVIEVLNAAAKVSIAQIITERPNQAIGKGDMVYNLAGPEKMLFAFAGKPEIYTIDEWTNFIRSNGGDVATKVQEGSQVADYLVLGQFAPDDKEAGSEVRAARDFGVKIITEKELQEAMGLM